MDGEESISARILRNLDSTALLDAAMIVAVSALAIVVIEQLTPRILGHAPRRTQHAVMPLLPLARLLIIVVAIISIVPIIIEPTVQNLIAFLGAAAVAIGFALKDYVSSLFAGVVAMFERPYRKNDWIEIGDDYGQVRDLGFRAVQIVTPDDTVVTIPHGRIWENNVRNANDGAATLLCVADFYLDPRHDAGRARRGLRDVAMTSPYLDLARPVVVIVKERPWGTHYRLKAYPVDAADQFLFTSDLTVRGKDELARLGCAPAAPPPAVATNEG
ncbi:mechanosensitive ion channel [Geminicoccaceae bacterium 1502E]|nr:mechanosensitive ion channel [Geminicoccaceae bacterium 1502E]